jgi:hypothetical protein
MTYALRPARLLTVLALALALLLMTLMAGAPTSASASADSAANAAKLKRCKAGWNKKKCRCPSSKRRVKRNGRYRCKKKAVAPEPNNVTTTPDPNTGTTPDPNQQPPATVQPVRDDAAFEAALNSTLLRKYDEGSYGYGRYAYNFLGDHQFLYCSYYYAGSTVESNKVGTWQVMEGYTVPGYPGYTAGKVRITGSGFDVAVAVEMLDNRSGVSTGSASGTFTEGSFTRAIGGAVTNCSAIE